MESPALTRLLRRAGEGDTAAAEAAYAAVYDELRRRAEALMARGGASTLQPTAVVNEAWLKLGARPAPAEGDGWRERGHFLAVASKAMRSVLVDHARARGAQRRGGDALRLPFDDALDAFDERGLDVLLLDEALSVLAEMDAELARLVELRFFGGLSVLETAATLGVSESTVHRSWRTARAWLRAELGADDEGGTP